MVENEEALIKVMVVDDSSVIRKIYKHILANQPGIKIVAEAEDGLKAILHQRKSYIDVIILDVEMPVMGGLEALPRLLSYDPNLVVIMASGQSQENADITLKALHQGAAEHLIKPSSRNSNTNSEFFSRMLVDKIRTLGRARNQKLILKNHYKHQHRRAKIAESQATSTDNQTDKIIENISTEDWTARRKTKESDKKFMRYHTGFIRNLSHTRLANNKNTDAKALIEKIEKPLLADQAKKIEISLRPIPKKRPNAFAIGASTGAVGIFKDFLPELIAIGPPIFLTQHMDTFFTKALTNQFSNLGIRNSIEVDNKYEVFANTLYIAQGGKHMVAIKEHDKIFVMPDDGAEEGSCKPSADVMLRSLSTVYQQDLLAIILSGMGKDGTKGSAEVIERGGHVIAQNKSSSVVWGMPKSVIDMGFASAILAPNHIASWCKSLPKQTKD